MEDGYCFCFFCSLRIIYQLLSSDILLQVTRSIGDDDLKPAVTAEPEITETVLSAEDEYIVRNSEICIPNL